MARSLSHTTVIDRPLPPPAVPPERVFVYGTLRPSLYPGVEKRFVATLVAAAKLIGPYQMHHLGRFPGLVKLPELPPAVITGEVIEMADLRHADAYEGYPTLYTRERVTVRLADGEPSAAWVYLFANPAQIADTDIITTGDWADPGPANKE